MENFNYELDALAVDTFVSYWNHMISHYGCIRISDIKTFMLDTSLSLVDCKYGYTEFMDIKSSDLLFGSIKLNYLLRQYSLKEL